jgi:hypothetical protein
MLLCTRERSISDSHNQSSLQRQFSHGHSQKFEDGGSGSGTRVSHFLPTSRRIVQFSNGKVFMINLLLIFTLMLNDSLFVYSYCQVPLNLVPFPVCVESQVPKVSGHLCVSWLCDFYACYKC